MKKILALCLSLAMLFSFIPANSAAAEATDTYNTFREIREQLSDFEPSGASLNGDSGAIRHLVKQSQPEELTNEDYRGADDTFAQINKMESAPEKKNHSQKQLTDAAEAIVLASDSYVEGTLERNGNSFTWWTDEGIRCIYSPSMREKYASMQAPENPEQDSIYNEPVALRANTSTQKQVYLVGPYYGYDDSFTNQYKNEAKNIAAAIGDTDGYTLYSGKSATVDKVASAVENGAVVIFDSHGTTDYDGDSLGLDPYGYRIYDYVSKANYSYLCLTTQTGLTTEDYNDGAAYFVDSEGLTCACINGETIVNHMDKNSPSGLVWMAMCLGMATDSFWEPLRAYGVEVVYGYSQSITFAMDYLYEETFWDHMIAGESVADSVGAMKSQWGNWDYSSQMCSYYDLPIAYTSVSDARKYYASFPVVVSDEDFYPGQRNRGTGFYGSCSTQEVKSSYTLEKPYGVPDVTDPAENYKKLGYYINRYGETDENGNKYWGGYLEAEGLSHYFVLTNTSAGIAFDYMITGEGTQSITAITSFVLKPNIDIMNVQLIIGLYEQDTLVDTLTATQPINLDTFTTASQYKLYESSTYLSSETATEYFNLTLQLLCGFWDETIYNALGFGLYRLGFDVYNGLGNENPNPTIIPEGLAYEIVDGTVAITGYTGSAEAIILPDVIDGLFVTAIEGEAFFECTELTSVTLGCNITTIGDGAFAYCTGLKKFHILKRVTSLGYLALFGCENMTQITVDADNPAYTTGSGDILYNKDRSILIQAPGAFRGFITIPYSVIAIADYAFAGTHISQMDLTSGNFTTIGEGAFSRCESLTSVTIGPKVSTIGNYAFEYCSALTGIVIPSSVTNIGTGAFMHCSNLKRINVNAGNPVYSSDEQYVLFNKDQTTLLQMPGRFSGSYTIPESVTAIANYAFDGCAGLTGITIPENVAAIGASAFGSCNGLKEVYYAGTQQEWSAIEIGPNNNCLLSAELIFTGVPAHDCTQCGQWTVTAEPTFTSAGEKAFICSQCGTVLETEPLETLVGEVAHWNISLRNDIRVKFLMQISASIADTASVILKIGEDTVTYRVSELDKHDLGYYIVFANISASQMNESISIQVVNGSEAAEVFTCTVRQYCDIVLSDNIYQAYHPLIKEMLNYGAMAQMYFDYDTDQLANNGITGTATAAVPATADKLTVNDNLNGLDFYGVSLVYRDHVAVRYYFTGDVTGLTFTANGTTYQPVAKDGMYFIEIPDILIQNLDQQITLTASDDRGILSVAYSPMNYIVRMNAKADGKTKNLLKALYNYHLAAKAL